MLQLLLTNTMLGIILAVITSLLWNIAPIIQKEALSEMEEIDAKNPMKHQEHYSLNHDGSLVFSWLL